MDWAVARILQGRTNRASAKHIARQQQPGKAVKEWLTTWGIPLAGSDG